ncbi:hypothetical protein HB364_29010 [Pseudoflavitalea sp. X16]|uniref:hypothetical protein n=1 Tax=Paraflavitalea devenefica TaxID=2716334 RepID=UPI001421DA58|nr:hypothetical protein [Paraflavitalea devenefica]NII29154.1 hypothetical protein [Paraflavitalea devenefica]
MKNVPNKKESKLPPELYQPTIKDVQILSGKTASTASRRLQELREALNREDHQAVFLTELCKYFAYPLRESCEQLGVPYNNN